MIVMSDKIAIDMLSAVATALAGRPCEVRYQSPKTKWLGGRCYRVNDMTVIEINLPLIPRDQVLKVFLHECAHALLDAEHYRPRAGYVPPQRRDPNAKRRNSKLYQLKEDRADAIAGVWLDICEQAGPGKTTIERLDHLLTVWRRYEGTTDHWEEARDAVTASGRV